MKEIQDGTDRAWESSEHGSLIRGLIESRLPEKEKTAERLKDWVQTFLTAGMFTVGTCVSFTMVPEIWEVFTFKYNATLSQQFCLCLLIDF